MHSRDPKSIDTFLHPSSYPGQSYADVAERLSILYFVPLVAAFVVSILFAILAFRLRPTFHLSSVLSVCLVPATWLTLIYADSSYKQSGNLLELSLLGAMVGVAIAIPLKTERIVLSSLGRIWSLCAIAACSYLFVPGFWRLESIF